MLVKPFGFLGAGRIPRLLNIGDYYQGGYIVYLYGNYPNQQGLIAAPTITATNVSWPSGVSTPVDTNYGYGYNNTESAYNAGSTTGAIGACWNYSNDGFSDWFLPDNTELGYLVTNLSVLPYYPITTTFHSSTAYTPNPSAQSWFYQSNGTLDTAFKSDLRDAIACRYIT